MHLSCSATHSVAPKYPDVNEEEWNLWDEMTGRVSDYCCYLADFLLEIHGSDTVTYSRRSETEERKATCLYEDLNFKLDRGYIERDFSAFKNPKQLILASSEWLSQEKLSQKLLEPIKDNMYANWLNVMETLVKHPLSWHAEEFIMSYRISVQADAAKEVFPEPQLDPDLNQKFVDAFGQKKQAFAEVRLSHPGTGKFSVNEKRLLEFFPELGNREQLMFPLQLTGMLGTVDITAKIADTETGSSSKANALRLAISRALACFLPGDLGANRLRAAGLLTQDDRFSERKKPGQKKARKKPIWKAR
ncbi:37S ribosomal protein S9, mitochondrial [Sparganum proliferum]